MLGKANALHAGVRRIVGARVSQKLRDALGPLLDSPEDLEVLTGIDRRLLARVLEGVDRPFSRAELYIIRRMSVLLAWEWGRDGVLVDLEVDHTRAIPESKRLHSSRLTDAFDAIDD